VPVPVWSEVVTSVVTLNEPAACVVTGIFTSQEASGGEAGPGDGHSGP
jgi:hypothetical protein